MANQLFDTSLFDRMADVFKAHALTSTCKVWYLTENVNTDGYYTVGEDPDETPTYVLYEGSEDIPCRLDNVPYIREEDTRGQELLINQFRIYLPNDFYLDTDARVLHNGRTYEVRKDESDAGLEPLNTAIIVELRREGG